MKGKQQTRPRHAARKSSGRVPLTYYRSSSGAASGSKSPFIRDNPPVRVKKIIFGTLDFLIIALLLSFFFYSLIVAPEPSISASNYTYHSANDYQNAAKDQLKSLSNRNKLTIDEDRIIKNLQTVFPEIASGSIELPVISQTPKFHLTISEPAFVLKNSDKSYIVAASGMVVEDIQGFDKFQDLPVVEDQSGFRLKAGSPAIDSAAAIFIKDLGRHFQLANIEVTSMVLPAVPMELNIRTTDKPYFIKFSLAGDAVLQAGQFIAARAQLEKDRILPSEYLDVRVQGKIFYK